MNDKNTPKVPKKNKPSTPRLPDLSHLKNIRSNLNFHLLVSAGDEYHFLVKEDAESPWIQMLEEAQACTLTRGLNAEGRSYYQLDFLGEEDCLIHRFLNEIPDVSEDGILEAQMFNWLDHLTSKRLRFWNQIVDHEPTHLGDLNCTLIRTDSVPYDYTLEELSSSHGEEWPYDLPYPYWEEWMITPEEYPEVADLPCQPSYTDPVYYDFNDGVWHSIGDQVTRAIAHYWNSTLTHFLKDGTSISFDHQLDSGTGQCYVHVRLPDAPENPVIAVMGTAWDKKYQDDFFIQMVELLISRSECGDWLNREELLNLEVVGRIPLIGVVYLQELDATTKSTLDHILIRYGLGIIECYCPESLPKK